MARTERRRIAPLAAAMAAALTIAALAPPLASAKPGDNIVLLESYSTSPAEVLLGGGFELRLKLRNAGSKKAEDLLLTLGSGSAGTSGTADGGIGGGGAGGAGGGSLVVVGGGNTKHLERLDGGEDAVVSFRLQSDPAGSPGLVALPVTLEYTSNGRRSLSQTVGIVLRRPTRLRVISLEAPEEAVAGEPFEVVAEVTNAGDAKVNGVSLRLEGAGAEVEDGETFLGNLEPGDGDLLEATVTAAKAGKARLTLTIAYLDEFGETRESTQAVDVDVTQADEPAEEPASGEADGGFLASIAAFFRALFGLGGE